MANFSQNGAIYIRQGGNDVTGDGSAANPYQSLSILSTLPGQSNSVVIVGDGVYTEELNLPSFSKIVADGVVIMEGAAFDTCFTPLFPFTSFEGLVIQNYNVGLGRNANNSFGGAENCFFKGNGRSVYIDSSFQIYPSFRGTIFKNGVDTSFIHNSEGTGFRNVTVDNDDIQLDARQGPFKLVNCHFEPSATLRIRNSSNCTSVSNCNIRGRVFVDSVEYADLAAAEAAHPNLFHACINQDPLFTDPSSDDYSLQIGSPNLENSADGTFIGAKGLGLWFDVQNASSSTNITVSAGEASLTGPGVGTITSQILDAGRDEVLNIPFYVGEEDYFGLMHADSDIALVEPNQRTIELRDCTEEEAASAGSASNALALKSFQHFIRNVPVTRDGAGRSNYDPNYDALSAQPVVARYVEIRITLRDNGIIS